MNFAHNISFIIPTYKLKDRRIKNIKFILSKLNNVGCKIFVVEQINKIKTDLAEIVKEYENVEYVQYKSEASKIHKTGMINYVVKNNVTTDFVWVNDVDYYMKFDKVLSNFPENKDFIQPYFAAKKLSEEESDSLLSNTPVEISFSETSADYISLYGALSFIFNKKAYLSLGGMDESIYGWGEEDIEFNFRLKSNQVEICKLEYKGIHLWHPLDISSHILEIDSKKDLAIITCYFNWCGFVNPTRNFHRFLRNMEMSEIPVYGLELSLTDSFETTGMKNWKQIKVSEKNVCFQKEACLNLVEKQVPQFYKKIAWVDCDLIFTNKNWYEETSKKLDTYKLVQMYSHGINTDKYGRIKNKFPGLMYMYDKVSAETWFKHSGYPGGAWGTRRDLWKNGGLYPYAIMGGGDTVFIYSIHDHNFSREMYDYLGISGQNVLDTFSSWRHSVSSYIGNSISYIDNEFIHEWHGDKKNRNYTDRHKILKKINIKKHVKLNDIGLIEISNSSYENIYNDIYEYFLNRDEDGVVEDMQEYLKFKSKSKRL